ncbi:outer membrane protein assembly factor BamB family protein [Thermus sediminis]|uniref:outer membrane protein assembly factor BamB family protein n=1 Tax=Thermus sediminis TaxID=1761908 RepID=UPI000E3BDCE0|nr:PQQ-binding-like beta-propeller repeat protein [Thermus sediminis]
MWTTTVRQVLGVAVLGLALAHSGHETAHSKHGAHGHHHDEEKLFTRIAVADARSPLVLVLEEEGKELARFTVPSPAALYPLPGGQYVLMVHRAGNAVGFLWGGLRLEDHGDHQDVKPENPYVAATLRTGPRPTHVFVDDRWAAVFHDGDGTVALFDLRRLGLDFTPRLVATGGADHGSVAVVGESVLAGGVEGGRLEVYTPGGQRVLTLPQACPRLHGQAVLGDWAAFGCADGVLLVQRQGRGFLGRKLPNPPGTPDGTRVGTLTAHPAHPFLVGNFGQGLALVHPKEGRLEVLPLPARPWRFAFDPEGEGLYVLTEDGRLHRLDPGTRRVVWSLEAVSPRAQGAPASGLAVGHGVAYLTDPQKGEVVRVDLKEGKVGARLQVGGAPSGIALFQVVGVEH